MGVSLGESPGFPWGKSKRLKWAEKRGFQGESSNLEIALHSALMPHRKHRKHRNILPCKMECHTDDTDEHRLLFREVMIGRGVVLQKLRNVKTKNNWE